MRSPLGSWLLSSANAVVNVRRQWLYLLISYHKDCTVALSESSLWAIEESRWLTTSAWVTEYVHIDWLGIFSMVMTGDSWGVWFEVHCLTWLQCCLQECCAWSWTWELSLPMKRSSVMCAPPVEGDRDILCWREDWTKHWELFTSSSWRVVVLRRNPKTRSPKDSLGVLMRTFFSAS